MSTQPTPRVSLPFHPLLIASAICAIAYGLLSPGLYAAEAPPYLMAIFKVSSIALLATVSAMANARLLTWALVFGGAGDVALALGDRTFMAGAVAFLVGHLCYIALFLRHRDRAALKQPLRLMAMLAVAAAAFISTSVLVPSDSAMFAPLGVYTGVLTLMTMASFTLPSKNWLAMLGAALFFISDGFVAADMFHPAENTTLAFWLSFTGWMIYWAGQACLCFGARHLHESAPRT